jgi:hypothetical protein
MARTQRLVSEQCGVCAEGELGTVSVDLPLTARLNRQKDGVHENIENGGIIAEHIDLVQNHAVEEEAALRKEGKEGR